MIEVKKDKLFKQEINENTRPDTENQVNIYYKDYNNLNSNIKNLRKKNNGQINDSQGCENVKINNFLLEDLLSNNKTCLNQDNEIVYLKKNLQSSIKDGSEIKNERFDRYNNPIIRGGKGKQKVTFIDKISKTNFIEVDKIESYKKYNKMEEVSDSKKNHCCILI